MNRLIPAVIVTLLGVAIYLWGVRPIQIGLQRQQQEQARIQRLMEGR